VRPALDRVKQIIDFIQEKMNQESFIVSAEKTEEL
jgi:hypothetical protein